MADDESKRTEELYKIYRDYVQHEDNLINHRTTALITIQSFILGTFGFTYQKKFEVVAKAYMEDSCNVLEKLKAFFLHKECIVPFLKNSIIGQYDIFMLFFPAIGMASSYYAFRSIRAAVMATAELEKKWKEQPNYKDAEKNLPGLTGGGNMNASESGKSLVQNAPMFLGLMWLLVFAFLLHNNFKLSIMCIVTGFLLSLVCFTVWIKYLQPELKKLLCKIKLRFKRTPSSGCQKSNCADADPPHAHG